VNAVRSAMGFITRTSAPRRALRKPGLRSGRDSWWRARRQIRMSPTGSTPAANLRTVGSLARPLTGETGVHPGVHIASVSDACVDVLRGFAELCFLSSALAAFPR